MMLGSDKHEQSPLRCPHLYNLGNRGQVIHQSGPQMPQV